MILIKRIFLIIPLLFIPILCNALEVVECEDENGDRAFFKHCPPNMTQVNTKKLKVDTTQNAPLEIKVIHYYADKCGACDQVTDFFKLRNVDVINKNVENNVELQEELQSLSDELRVPTIVIEDEVIQGFSRDKLIAALEKAGWKAPEEK